MITTIPGVDRVIASLAQTSAIAIAAGRIQSAAAFDTVYSPVDAQAVGRVFERPPDLAPDEAFEEDLAAISDSLLAGYALGFAAAAERELARLSAADPLIRVIRDQPMVTIAGYTLRARQGVPGVAAALSLDIRHNVVRVAVATGESGERAFWTNVQHGLIDGALEHHFPSLIAASPPVLPNGAHTLDTTTAVSMARTQGIPIRAAQGADGSGLLQNELATAGGHRLVSEISDDVAIVTPVRPVTVGGEARLGLWSVHVGTGHVVALLDTGLRQNMIENVLTRAAVAVMRVTQVAIRACVKAGGNCVGLFRFWARVANFALRMQHSGAQIAVSQSGSLSYVFGLL
jgi:hypothetical protein